MKKIMLFLLPLVLFLPACGSHQNDGGAGLSLTSTGTTTDLTHLKNFVEATGTPGSTASFGLTGNDSNGISYTGTMRFTVNPETTMESETVKVASQYLSVTDTATGAWGAGTRTAYLSISRGCLVRVANRNGSVSTPLSQRALPPTAKVGDSGIYAALSRDDGDSETISWRLDPGTNRGSIFAFTSVVTSGKGTTMAIEEDRFHLDPAGNVYAIDLTFDYPGMGFSRTLSGPRL
ncbi:hypothetical protein [Geobacter sp. DSM 9736]|uniref:hypothetical protein n=1 Tax=Geobacter sp. DSM 9736 TaxID=1277350 RepID=UPI000B50E43F|nr:hypothetical protein [Geobacter sp. DSM 9736]SNB45873.1 hypothetical protein SAMN06269301_1303 [Geobacter sp. DSM 9736]